MQININNMATLVMKEQQQQQKYKQHNKVNDNITKQLTLSSIFTTKQEQEQNQYQHNRHHNSHNSKNNSKYQQKQNKSIKDVEEEFGDIYHIKQCYQPIINLKTATTTKCNSLNQRTKNDYNYFTPTLTTTKATATTNTSRIPTTALRTPTAATTTLSLVLNSLSNNCRSFVSTTVLFYLLLIPYAALAAPQSCILCDKNDLLAKDPQKNYEEFLFEHQVTRQDAINALRQLNDSFYEGTASDSSCNGVRCTEKVMKYCLGPQFINDHCWCEVGHSTEGLPFVPHICYVGEKIYKTSVGSCFFYEEVKDCCCSSVLAKEWRHISAGSSIYSKTWLHNYYMLVVISLLYLLIRRSFN